MLQSDYVSARDDSACASLYFSATARRKPPSIALAHRKFDDDRLSAGANIEKLSDILTTTSRDAITLAGLVLAILQTALALVQLRQAYRVRSAHRERRSSRSGPSALFGNAHGAKHVATFAGTVVFSAATTTVLYYLKLPALWIGSDPIAISYAYLLLIPCGVLQFLPVLSLSLQPTRKRRQVAILFYGLLIGSAYYTAVLWWLHPLHQRWIGLFAMSQLLVAWPMLVAVVVWRLIDVLIVEP